MSKSQKLVIALGGNAIKSPAGNAGYGKQFLAVEKSARNIAEAIKRGYSVVITHGNGPQVGDLLIQQEISKDYVAPMPLAVCVAETQAQIGLMIKQSLENELKRLKIKKDVIVSLTQVLIDPSDPAFRRPTKPIGPFYTPKEASRFKRKGITMKKIMAGAYRRVVASPAPKKIIEIETIKNLLKKGVVVVGAGGGGIPVTIKRGEIKIIDAVIDKDLASQVLASSLGADILIILTDVKGVALNFASHNQIWLDKINIKEARKYLKEGQFQAGSMGPKVEAAVRFIEKGGKKTIIAHLKDLLPALDGRAGTLIVKN